MNSEFRLMPEQATSLAAEVDLLYAFLLVVSAVMTIAIAFLIFFFAIKYRRGSKADRTQGHTHFLLMEVGWIALPFVLTMIMFFWGARLFFLQSRAPADAMQIDCVGKQWMWKFQHPQGASEINDLHVPLGQAVRLNMISEDVIHSVFVPAFRIKQDVLPGRYTSLWFRPNKVGVYRLFCAEYCGAKHSEMKGYVTVMEPREYQEWLSGRSNSAASQNQSLFDQFRCGTCHLPAGQTGRGPALEGILGSTVRLQNGQSIVADEAYLRESIMRPTAKVVAGYQPLMPSFEGQLNEEAVLQLIKEIKAMTPPPTRPVEAAPAPQKQP